MNKVVESGRICQDLELKQTQNGVPVLSFNLAVSRPRVKDTTDYLPIVCWRQNAEYLSQYAMKGSFIELSGTVQSRKYQDNNGNNRTVIEIVADEVKIIQNPQKAGETAQPAFTEQETPNFEEVVQDDELPF